MQAEGNRGGGEAMLPPGAIRVIVHLRVPSGASERPEAGAPQHASIQRAREALLHELASMPHRVTRMYEAIPFVALEVSPEALRIVEKSPWVVGIEPDALVAPQPGTGTSHSFTVTP